MAIRTNSPLTIEQVTHLQPLGTQLLVQVMPPKFGEELALAYNEFLTR
jgi:hypothetical protein